MKGYSSLSRFPEVEFHHKQFSVIPGHFLFGGSLPLCRGYSHCILSSADRATLVKRLNVLIFANFCDRHISAN